MGAAGEASAGKAPAIPYPVWRHGSRSYARGVGGKWQKSAVGLEKVVQYLAEVPPPLSPAAAAAAAAAAATAAAAAAAAASAS
eukprot:328457-Pelagomonas_calceolata.AAC.1